MAFTTHSQKSQDNVFHHNKITNNISSPLPAQTNYITENSFALPYLNIQVNDLQMNRSDQLTRDDSWVESRLSDCLTSSSSYNDLRADCPFSNPPMRYHSDNRLYPNPPLPPRDYLTPKSKPKNKIEIHPVVQDGVQKSNTHYWLLPEKIHLESKSQELEDYENYAKKFILKTNDKINTCTAKTINNKPDLSCGLSGLLKTDRRGGDREFLINDSDDVSCNFSFDNLANENMIKSGENLSDSFGDPKSCQSFLDGDSTATLQIYTMEDKNSKSMSDARQMIQAVLDLVKGTSFEEAQAALSMNQWSVQAAVKYLLVENLFRLGLASREQCRTVLEYNDWQVEAAADEIVRSR